MLYPEIGFPIADKHIGNSAPKLFKGEVTDVAGEKLYGVLPVTANTLKAGIHPLSTPATIAYYYDFYYATEYALSLSEKGQCSVNSLNVGITCLMNTQDVIKHYANNHPTLVGIGPVYPDDVAQVYMTVHNPATQETHTFDTTGLTVESYKRLMDALEGDISMEQLQQLITEEQQALQYDASTLSNNEKEDGDVGDDAR